MSTTTTPHASTRGTTITRAASLGAVAGVIASLMMAAYAMIAAATYQGSGFFTPLYHIASVFISPADMMASMKSATAGGSIFEFFAGPALVGALVHMMVGAMYGVGFAVLARLTRVRGMALVAAAVIWGALVFVISSFVGLPLAAALFNSGDQITNMAELVGYGTFLVEHLIFGLFLGVILVMFAKRAR
ncbi:hypothetical protein [Janibacter sp. GS2]|uniref:hypothetical protein n=1 Tax=Janibacter sp. GS2 TaxID=3442646 RepID=UPI003EBA2AB6